MRGLIGLVFPSRPAFWQLFYGSGRDAGSARVALSLRISANLVHNRVTRVIRDHPKVVEFLNTPIENYLQMQQIYSYALATDKHNMGSSEPLGFPMLDYRDIEVYNTIVFDGPKSFADHILVLDGNRKRARLMDE
ncbi:Histone-lysine N-methyltransferase SUVR5 [Hordeum vulgare]|nr:Histone-lysine N-methyltransferase SUVR5 [Hordeum vulgare]KAE8799231.1 Histone-lysine N-methyltransferase SUVR5 [Hordeum vulgare]